MQRLENCLDIQGHLHSVYVSADLNYRTLFSPSTCLIVLALIAKLESNKSNFSVSEIPVLLLWFSTPLLQPPLQDWDYF